MVTIKINGNGNDNDIGNDIDTSNCKDKIIGIGNNDDDLFVN